MKTTILFFFIFVLAFTAFGQQSSDNSVGTIIASPNDGSFSFTGIVVDVTGRGVRNARLQLLGINGNSVTLYRQSNSSGYFRFINVPNGSYALYAIVRKRAGNVRVIHVDERSDVTFNPKNH